MRLANCLDQSYKQKVEGIAVSKKDRELVIAVDVNSDYTLEKGIFRENVDFFEEIYDLKPVLKIRNNEVRKNG